MKLSIVAFMQNPWFPPGTPQDFIHQYRTMQEFHQSILKETMSGRRLHMAFGDEMFRRIWWDNVAPEASDHPRTRTEVDQKHIDAIIAIKRPNLILTFGDLAKDALKENVASIKTKMMHCHHPNARFRFQADLDYFAQQVWDYVLVTERDDEFTKKGLDVS